MWKLEMRGARGTPFEDLGNFASIVDAAAAVAKIENEPPLWIFFNVSIDLYNAPSDAEILSHLSYQGAARYYELTRSMQ